ncbi:TlpA family protein disulfide reductase [Phytohabitans sp. LJ34]|uniref:TlpA family protein disulfide reductase n=1 Tax=Phytohabitans sp. LJ34 TaxID=3452217 RepID=UPI003F8C9C6B
MSRVGHTIAAATVAFLLAGCGGDATPGSAGDPTVTTASTLPASTPTGGSVAVPQALTFTTQTVDGKPFDAATLAGKPVVLWFWAAWCPRCRAAADDVAGVQRDFADRVHVVGVAGLNSGAEPMRRFVADQGISGFVNLADDEGEIWRRFGVTTQEYYVLLDTAGTVVHKGPLTPDALRDRVTALAG